MLTIGIKAPEFSAPDQDGKIHQLSDYNGRWLLLYFYPKDNTPGCTTEACTFRDSFGEFKKINAAVVGVSKDSVQSHAGFAAKYSLPFTIVADSEKKIIEAYEVESRVSYLIDPKGVIAKAYTKVKPAEHAAEVIKDIRELSAE